MKRKLIVLSMATVLAAGFVGCATDDADRDSHKRSAGRYLDDKMLIGKVKGALDDNAVYKFPDVKVNTYNGTVQLTGFVDTMEQKRKAEEIARNVPGVAAIQNEIALKGDTERVRSTDANRDLDGDGRIDSPPPRK